MAPKITPKMMAGGAAVYFATAVGAYLYLRGQKAKEGPQAASGGEQRRGPGELAKLDPRIWSSLAARYDAEIERDETAMGLKLLRWWLIRQAQARSRRQRCYRSSPGRQAACPCHLARWRLLAAAATQCC